MTDAKKPARTNSSDEEQIKTINKLIVLFFIDKMDISLSNSQITQYTLEEEFMDYFALQEALGDLQELGYLSVSRDNNTTRYSITEQGLTTLDYFEKHIPADIRGRINKFVVENRKSIKKDYEITANYFYDHANNEYIVKCGVYEDESMLMEINLSVVAREQAKVICTNWKKNVNRIYVDIISELVAPRDVEAAAPQEPRPAEKSPPPEDSIS